jgi:hypothetical protein
MIHEENSVFLKNLPEGLRFPDDLASRIRYDQGERRLFFRGFMSKAQFDLLHGLSNDGSYQLAIERLFELCVPGHDRSSTLAGFGRWIRLGFVFFAGLGAMAGVGWKIWSHLVR